MGVNDWPRYEIVAATTDDIPAVLGLARHLNTVNLPNDYREIRELLERSERSFLREMKPVERREYVFLLRDSTTGRAMGTSMVLGRLGRRDAPYIYFAVRKEEMYSATLDRLFTHTVLDTTYVYGGPTELGGLVMDPVDRGRPERFGSLISFVRMLFIRMRRPDFQDQLLAELLPPFRPDGTSPLWEAVGRRFTGLSYDEADRLSRSNKEFIRGLFPTQVCCTLLDREAQDSIGLVGPQTQGVEKLLRRVGFSYAERVDPFDGGPHFIAPTNQVSIIQNTRRATELQPEHARSALLVGAELPAPPYFCAARLPPNWCDSKNLLQALVENLGAASPQQVWFTPWPDSR